MTKLHRRNVVNPAKAWCQGSRTGRYVVTDAPTAVTCTTCKRSLVSLLRLRPFSPASFWYTPLPADAPVCENSAAVVENVIDQIARYYDNVAVNTQSNSATVYVPFENDATDVTYSNCQRKKWIDPKFVGQLKAVPIPFDAVPSGGTDSEMVIWDWATNTVWELWRAQKRADGSWAACWGGRLDDVSESDGVFPQSYGVAASGLSLLGGMIRVHELQAGLIPHVIDIALPDVRKGAYSWPANRTDGKSDDPNTLLEGQRLRLDPTLDIESLKLSRFAKTIARAMQVYGAIVRDRSGAVSLYCENAKPWIATGDANPYDEIFEGKASYTVMKGFPWDRVQVLPVDYGKVIA